MSWAGNPDPPADRNSARADVAALTGGGKTLIGSALERVEEFDPPGCLAGLPNARLFRHDCGNDIDKDVAGHHAKLTAGSTKERLLLAVGGGIGCLVERFD